MHRLRATHETELSAGADGNEPIAVQVWPSRVTATAAEPTPAVVPTATQLCASTHATPYSAPMPATVVDVQVRPASVEVRTVATSAPPTTTHVVAVGQDAPYSCGCAGSLCGGANDGPAAATVMGANSAAAAPRPTPIRHHLRIVPLRGPAGPPRTNVAGTAVVRGPIRLESDRASATQPDRHTRGDLTATAAVAC